MNREELHSIIADEQLKICQIVAVKDNEIVYSDTWNNYKEKDNVHIASVTKSIISVLIGIAIDKGLIKSADDFVIDYYRDIYTPKRGERTIYQVTIKHLLTMTAPFKGKNEPWKKVCTSEDWTLTTMDVAPQKV